MRQLHLGGDCSGKFPCSQETSLHEGGMDGDRPKKVPPPYVQKAELISTLKSTKQTGRGGGWSAGYHHLASAHFDPERKLGILSSTSSQPSREEFTDGLDSYEKRKKTKWKWMLEKKASHHPVPLRKSDFRSKRKGETGITTSPPPPREPSRRTGAKTGGKTVGEK